MTTIATSSAWVRPPQPNPQARLRLFCFPYAGGGASVYRLWPEALPAQIEVCPVQLPGREGRMQEAPFTRLVPLVQTLARVLRPYLDIPFAFFGHSLGALISFELARQLRRQVDLSPVRLFMAACSAPQLSNPGPPIHQLPEAAFVAELRRLDGTPELILEDPNLLDLFLPLLRADFELYETYTYLAEAPLDCPLSAFGGLQDRRVDRGALAAWRDQTTGDLSLRMFPGNHFFLESDRWLLLQAVTQDLAPLPGWMARGHRP